MAIDSYEPVQPFLPLVVALYALAGALAIAVLVWSRGRGMETGGVVRVLAEQMGAATG